MPDVKISAGADPVTLLSTDKVPLARSASTTAYAATMAEFASYANGAYTPPWYAGSPAMDGAASAGTAAFVSRGDHVHPSDTTKYAASNPSGYQTAAQVATAVAPAFNGVGRNYIHNPLFNVAQRGAGAFNAQGLTLDRWQLLISLDTASVSQAALTDAHRAAIGDEEARYCLGGSVTGNAGAASYSAVIQRIENVRRLAGKTVTISFWAVAAPSLKLGVAVAQLFGTGGSPSTAVAVNGQSVTVATAFTRYSVTFAIPSAAGKTLGTNGDDSTQIAFYFSCGATNAIAAGSPGVQTGSISIWGVQLEIGSVATPLEKPDPRYDLANCQRFYELCVAVWAGDATTGQTYSVTVPFAVEKRASPALVSISQTNAVLGGFGVRAGTASNQPTRAGIWYGAVSAATGPARGFHDTFSASADL